MGGTRVWVADGDGVDVGVLVGEAGASVCVGEGVPVGCRSDAGVSVHHGVRVGNGVQVAVGEGVRVGVRVTVAVGHVSGV